MRPGFSGQLLWAVAMLALGYVAQHAFAQDASPRLYGGSRLALRKDLRREASGPDREKESVELARAYPEPFLSGSDRLTTANGRPARKSGAWAPVRRSRIFERTRRITSESAIRITDRSKRRPPRETGRSAPRASR